MGGYDMLIPLEILLKKINKIKENKIPPRKQLELEEILPEDIPKRDSPFPSPPPNKRVIIIDI